MSPFVYSKAVFLQLAAIIGSGIFVLPYIFSHSNFYFALLALIVAFAITYCLNRFYIEVILHTRGDHQLVGYSSLYLPPFFRILTLVNILLLAVGAITAYQQLFVSFLTIIFPYLNPIYSLLFFILIASLATVSFNSRLSIIFDLLPVIILLVPFVLFFASLSHPAPTFNLVGINHQVFGALLFSLSGFTIIPEIEQHFRDRHLQSTHTFTSSLVGLGLSVLIYYFFIISVLRLTQGNPSLDSLSSVAQVNPILGLILAILGLVVTQAATINFLHVIRELFYRDLKTSSSTSVISSLLFLVIPLFLFSFRLDSLISLTGAVTIFISGLTICLIRLRIPHRIYHRCLALLNIIGLAVALFLELFAVSF